MYRKQKFGKGQSTKGRFAKPWSRNTDGQSSPKDLLDVSIEIESKLSRRQLTSLERAFCQILLTIGDWDWPPDLESPPISSFSTLQLSFQLQVAEMHQVTWIWKWLWFPLCKRSIRFDTSASEILLLSFLREWSLMILLLIIECLVLRHKPKKCCFLMHKVESQEEGCYVKGN